MGRHSFTQNRRDCYIYILNGLDANYTPLILFVNAREEPVSDSELYIESLSYERLQHIWLGEEKQLSTSANLAMRGCGLGRSYGNREEAPSINDRTEEFVTREATLGQIHALQVKERSYCVKCVASQILKLVIIDIDMIKIFKKEHKFVGAIMPFYGVDTN